MPDEAGVPCLGLAVHGSKSGRGGGQGGCCGVTGTRHIQREALAVMDEFDTLQTGEVAEGEDTGFAIPAATIEVRVNLVVCSSRFPGASRALLGRSGRRLSLCCSPRSPLLAAPAPSLPPLVALLHLVPNLTSCDCWVPVVDPRRGARGAGSSRPLRVSSCCGHGAGEHHKVEGGVRGPHRGQGC